MMRSFELVSGLQVNFCKSHLGGIGVEFPLFKGMPVYLIVGVWIFILFTLEYQLGQTLGGKST